MKRLKGDCFLFTLGGLAYALIEILYRHRTHWTMAVTGGVAFVSLFRFWKSRPLMKTFRKCICGSAIITCIEFFTGCIVNLKLKLNVWDYTNCRFNIKGQICPFYSILWALLCLPVSCLCKRLCKSDKL